MANVDNLNKMIEAIRAEKQPIRMAGFVASNTACGTTACLAGWANILRQDGLHKGLYYTDDQGREIRFGNSIAASEWMGISEYHGDRLFYNFAADELPFDQRKEAAIRLLERIRDTGDGAWSDVIQRVDGVVTLK